MLKELFRWIDAHPGLYWALASASAVMVAVWIAWSFTTHGRSRRPRLHASVTGFVLLLALLGWRWPPLFGIEELNPDESQLIAGALTLKTDPLPWRSVDGTTSGPLNFFILLPTHLLGIPADYFNARLTGLLLAWATLWAGYALLQRSHPRGIALLGILPGLVFFATAIDSDFVHYSSEHLSVALILISGWLLWKARGDATTGRPFPRGTWLAAGAIIGMLPWAKLQSSPMAVALAAWGAALAWTRTDLSWRERGREVLLLAIATLSVTAGFLIVIGTSGQWEHFYRCYIENNLIYASSAFTIPAALEKLYVSSMYTRMYPASLAGPLFVIGVWAVMWLVRPYRPDALFGAGALLTAASVYTVLAPRQGFHHYLLYTIPPLMWWSGAALGSLFKGIGPREKKGVLGLAFVLMAAGLPLALRASYSPSFMFGHFYESWRQPHGDAAKLIRAHRQPDDRLAVWGWHNQLYVETALPQATRESHSTRQLWESSQRDTYYRPRYLHDLKRNEPAFFVDAVGPGSFYFNERSLYAHETFEELRTYIATHYTLVDDFEKMRVYFRNDRLPAIE